MGARQLRRARGQVAASSSPPRIERALFRHALLRQVVALTRSVDATRTPSTRPLDPPPPSPLLRFPMLRIDFESHSRDRSPSPTSPMGRESATLSGHKLSPTAQRCAFRCPSLENLGVENVMALHLPVCTTLQQTIPVPATPKKQDEQPTVRQEQKAKDSDTSLETTIHLDEPMKTTDEVVALSLKIACSPNLEVLNLPYNRLGDKLDILIQALSAGRLSCEGLLPNLRALNLCGNAMNDETFSTLMIALEMGGLPNLSMLDVSSNRLTTLAPLARAAEAMPLKLSVLKAEYNSLESLDAIVDATVGGRFPLLHTLWIAGNLLSDNSLEALGKVVGKGSSLRTVHISMNYFTYQATEALQAGAASSVHLVW
ncbi:hypothetical protein AB1Y20_020859 [Prymnesium parvum]|uniref:Uncharacterized protein n=1 Tax=Prymnesium parvum TaxID=97485 RepID=A0AB34JV80_PRYPA